MATEPQPDTRTGLLFPEENVPTIELANAFVAEQTALRGLNPPPPRRPAYAKLIEEMDVPSSGSDMHHVVPLDEFESFPEPILSRLRDTLKALTGGQGVS